ncbi:MAG: anthranilate synthase component I family protein [Nocardioidaceae bacterium]
MMRWREPEEVATAVAARYRRMFWLDGVGAAEWSGRGSIVGWLEDDEPSVARGGDVDGFWTLADRLRADAELWWVGWFGYAARRDLCTLTDDAAVPVTCWMPARHYVVFDAARRVMTAVGATLADVPVSSSPVSAPGPASRTVTWDERRYATAFGEVQRQLRLGNSYEVNLTYREVVASRDRPFEVYRRLRRLNPAPYAAYLQHDGVAVLSSSPERFARIADGWCETRPIKGTLPRSADALEDAANAARLGRDPKLRAENLIVTDLLRNDLSVVSEPGTVTVPRLMEVESYANVHQLVTTVRGRLRDGIDPVEVARSLSPGGSMTGAPKRRTMEIIAAVEDTPRGVYAGSLGWMSPRGADLGLVIRSLVHDGERYVAGTGGGVTVGSDAASEFAETRLKLAPLLAALGVTPLPR